MGEFRRTEQTLSKDEGSDQDLPLRIPIPEVKSVTTLLCVVRVIENETDKATTLRPPFRIMAYPPKDSYLTRIESGMKKILQEGPEGTVKVFGSADNSLVRLLKACKLPVEDLGEDPPDRWEAGNIYFGEFTENGQELSARSPFKPLLAVFLETDPETGSCFLEMVNGKSRIRLQVSDDPDFFTEDPEVLHLFTRYLHRLITSKE